MKGPRDSATSNFANDLRREQVRELRRERLGEGREVGAFVVREAAGGDDSAQVWIF